jgi:hypothetical protein
LHSFLSQHSKHHTDQQTIQSKMKAPMLFRSIRKGLRFKKNKNRVIKQQEEEEVSRKTVSEVSISPAKPPVNSPTLDSFLLSNAAKVESCLDRLTAMELCEKENLERYSNVLGSNICDNLVTAMMENSDSVDVQWKACWIVADLTFHNGDDKQSYKAALHNAGVSKAIVQAMKTFVHHEQMQQSASVALRNLAFQGQAGAKKVANAGAIEALLCAMKHYPDNHAIQEDACACLDNLASAQPCTKQAIIEQGGIDSILAAMEQHKQVEGLQKLARDCLYTLEPSRLEVLHRLSARRVEI